MTVTERKARLEELAKPRPLHQDYIQDRVSVYWVDTLPLLPSNGRTQPALTARQEELVQPKRRADSADRFCDPMWPVSESAMSYEPSPRIYQLAKHKSPPSDYQPRRPVRTVIPDSALTTNPTPRVSQLARHKEYYSLPIINPQRWDWSDWEDRIPPNALKAVSSDRICYLSTPKRSPTQFRGAKSCIWPVSSAVKTWETTERVTKLAMPRARTMIKDDYDPYYISKSALRANPTPRTEELAAPLTRKISQKK